MKGYLIVITSWSSRHLRWMALPLQTLQKFEPGLLCHQVVLNPSGIVMFDLCR